MYYYHASSKDIFLSDMLMNTQIYQVSDLVGEMRRLMEKSYPEIWIEGEISSLSTPASGHIYFTLKDEQSQLRCAMFRNRLSLSRYKAKAGDLIRIRAKISVYTARGELQCIVQHMEDAGEGVLQRRYEELKYKLDKEGLFKAAHKLSIPDRPQRIGIITSPSGAVIKDILTTLARRCPTIPLTIYPAVVQGDGAAETLIEAIANAIQHQQCDVLILARGGGSLEDLWCFNNEDLAREIYHCPIPIVSAVGHEVDTTIADYVADLRAPTPTAAAELLSPDNVQLLRQNNSLAKRLKLNMTRLLQQRAQQIDIKFQKIRHPATTVANNKKQLHGLIGRLQRNAQTSLRQKQIENQRLSHRFCLQPPKRKLGTLDKLLHTLSDRLMFAQKHLQTQHRKHFESFASQLHLVSPLATLERGFSIARDGKGHIIRDAESTKQGDALSLKLSKGELQCRVEQVVKAATK